MSIEIRELVQSSGDSPGGKRSTLTFLIEFEVSPEPHPLGIVGICAIPTSPRSLEKNVSHSQRRKGSRRSKEHKKGNRGERNHPRHEAAGANGEKCKMILNLKKGGEGKRSEHVTWGGFGLHVCEGRKGEREKRV